MFRCRPASSISVVLRAIRFSIVLDADGFWVLFRVASWTRWLCGATILDGAAAGTRLTRLPPLHSSDDFLFSRQPTGQSER